MSTAETGAPVTFDAGLSWTRARVPRLLSRIGKACFLVSALGALMMLWRFSPFAAVPMLVGVLAWPFFILSYILSLTQTAFRGSVTVSNHELVVRSGSRARVIPTAEIAGALVVERLVAGTMVPALEIELGDGDRLTVRMPEPPTPHQVARMLGFGPGLKRVRTTLAKPTRRLLHPLFGFATYSLSVSVLMLFVTGLRPHGSDVDTVFFAYPLPTLLLYMLLQWRVARAPEVTVGDDGIAVRVDGKTKLVARRDIAFVGTPPDGRVLAIEEYSGKRVAISGVMLDRERLAAVERLILGWTPLAALTDRLAHYDRAGRPLSAWRDHLAHAMNEASYRQNAATVDEAASVLRSAQASPEQRVGAALALRVAGQPPERIRIAAASAADDRVREALEAVADADDDVVIEKALKRLQS